MDANSSSGTIDKIVSVPQVVENQREEGAFHNEAAAGGVERSTWANKGDFFMTAISSAIGLGNIWRFPYKCYSNGGGAFLVAFVITILLVGFPLVCLDLALGQLGRCGPLQIWKICPAFEGVGWAILGLDLVANFYYILLVALGLLYMFHSFRETVPWASCGNEWNTAACRDMMWIIGQKDCHTQNGTWFNNTCYLAANLTMNTLQFEQMINSSFVADNGFKPISPSEEFFHNHVLDLSEGVGHLGNIQLPLLGCLLLAWVLVFLGLCLGVKSWGKISYVTALLPYVILTAILVQTLTEEGALNGIIFFIKPEWSSLASATVWADAVVQAFFSLNCGGGVLITIGSFNKTKNNCFLDGIILTMCDFATSILCGLVVFAILGHLAHSLNLHVSEVVGQGAGLAFVAYPEMLARLPMAPVWASLFMFMIFNLGLGSSMPITANVHTILVEKFPTLFSRGRRPLMLLIGLIVVWALLGITLTTQGGIYILQMLDSTAPYVLVVTGLCKVVSVGWVYGLHRVVACLGDRISTCGARLWILTCKFTAPLAIMVVLVLNFVNYRKLSYGSYHFPLWAEALGWTTSLILISVVPFAALYKFIMMDKKVPFKKRLHLLIRPTGQWCDNENDVDKLEGVLEPLNV